MMLSGVWVARCYPGFMVASRQVFRLPTPRLTNHQHHCWPGGATHHWTPLWCGHWLPARTHAMHTFKEQGRSPLRATGLNDEALASVHVFVL